MTKAFRRYTGKKQFCAVGALKTNIGHLDNAAGIASMVRAVLALGKKEIPPILHFEKPNRNINFEDSPLYINKVLLPWNTAGFPRRCGVSAFGLSGTNCHVVLEEPPANAEKDERQNEV
nr:ketoacyl-synthetase C-terminal extension domain-containing protein [Acetivibrio straminisolvens]